MAYFYEFTSNIEFEGPTATVISIEIYIYTRICVFYGFTDIKI